MMNRLDLSEPEERVLGKILRRQAESIPDAPFLLFGEQRYTFAQANELANAYAAGFQCLGVSAGDTVALFMTPSPACVFATLGINKLGAVWIPTNTDYRGEWLEHSLRASCARVVVADGPLIPRLAELGEGLGIDCLVQNGPAEASLAGVRAIALSELAAGGAPEPEIRARFRDTAAVLWMSGTTGRPKGVMQSHNAWLHGPNARSRTIGFGPATSCTAACPFTTPLRGWPTSIPL